MNKSDWEYNEDDSEGFCEGDDELSECFFGKYISIDI
jgi:hypothetical protein